MTNTDSLTRVWPGLRVDGHTLELGPGETADVDVPPDFADPYLRAARAAKPDTTKPEAKES